MERSNKKPKQKPNADHIMAVRCLLLKNNFLVKPKVFSTHTDLTGKVNVANDVLQLKEISNENMLNYLHIF